MAKVVENKKGFKVIEVSCVECVEWGGLGICDNCNDSLLSGGIYVAVLNRVFCPKCYEEWMTYAVYYPEDSRVEKKNFEFMKKQLGL